MLTQLRFQNFKSWKDTGEIRMAPLTGLFGTNSSGKTAILQFLLMLKQTADAIDSRTVLEIGGEKSIVNLHDTSNVVHKNENESNLSSFLKWIPLNPPKLPSHEALVTTPAGELSALGFETYQRELEYKSLIHINALDREVTLQEFNYTFFDSKKCPISVGMKRNLFGEDGEKYSLYSSGDLLDDVWKNPFLLDDPLPVRNYGFPVTSITGRAGDFLANLVSAFEEELQEIYYLGPLREHPKYTYNWTGHQPRDVGRSGELTAQALLASQRRRGGIAVEKVSTWLKKLGLVDSFELQNIASNRPEYEILIRRDTNSAEVPIPNVGFGVSQILPVLTLCYYAPEGSTIILEQPEIHLHPSAQAGLADVFIDAIKTRNVQIIVESHSEHLLRRLQRRIAEEELDSNSAALYFCNMGDDGASTLLPLELDTYGNINNWPKGFFGDEMGELFAMSEAALERQMRDEKVS